jgi:hypothetical protein
MTQLVLPLYDCAAEPLQDIVESIIDLGAIEAATDPIAAESATDPVGSDALTETFCLCVWV